MVGTKPTIIRTGTLIDHYIWSMCPFSVHPIGAKLLVHLVGAKVKFLALSMSRTGFGHVYLSFSFENLCIQYHVTVWTDTLCVPNRLLYCSILTGKICYLN